MSGDEKKQDENSEITPENLGENGNNETAPESVVTNVDRETELTRELLYLRAEFDNYRKRILREQENAIKYANEKLVRELVPVVDLFDRAVQMGGTLKARLENNELKNEMNSFVVGVEMTAKELLQTLGRIGVEFVGNKNETFDPQRHEAISEMETENADEVGKVVQVAQRGCVLSGRLLKPAQVVVGKSKS